MAFAELGDHRRAWELFSMINPVNHAKSAAAVATYKVEPYVMAADVYAVAPHIGRGGWTWYTGSAGWMYRLALESLLGLRLEGDKLRLAPCLPAHWPGFKLRYRYRDTVYRISVVRDESSSAERSDHVIPLVDDRGEHRVEVRIR
jgi:cellobiose phosphorylase